MRGKTSGKSQFSKSVEMILARFERERSSVSGIADAGRGEWGWDEHQDTEYANCDPRFDGVLHIFHREWFGIRSAAGSLPGRKLVVSAVNLSDVRLDSLALEVLERNPDRIVFHGFSNNMGRLIRRLREMDVTEKLFSVFHGSPAQWWDDVERRFAFEVIDLAKNGFIRNVHIMKKGVELPGLPLFKPLLYNMSPNHGMALERFPRAKRVSAFVPGWGNWIKNVFGSAYGAALSDSVDEVAAFADGLQLPEPLNKKLVILSPLNRTDMFKRYLSSRLTLNVSLVDCHPMVNVESQSLGRPCVRSNLNLDCYEDHEYVRIVTASHNNSPSDIRDAVNRVLDISQDELKDIVLDYQGKVDALAIERYLQFLEM